MAGTWYRDHLPWNDCVVRSKNIIVTNLIGRRHKSRPQQDGLIDPRQANRRSYVRSLCTVHGFLPANDD